MPWRNLANEKYPEVMEQIHRDLTLGYKVLGIPKNDYTINLYDHGYYTLRKFRYGEVHNDDRCLDFYLSDLPVETEEDKANMSFVIWCTQRFWFRYECVKTWEKEHKLLPFVTEEEIKRHPSVALTRFLSYQMNPSRESCTRSSFRRHSSVQERFRFDGFEAVLRN